MKKFIFATALAMMVTSLQAGVDFNKDIKPILEARCVKCHGAKKQKGEFALHTAKDIVVAGESEEKPLVAGDPDKSYLVKLISMHEDDDDVMPPKCGTLTKDQITKIKSWIKEGAKYPADAKLEDKSKKKKK